MAADDAVKIAIGALTVGALGFFLCVQIALMKEFAHSRRAARMMRWPRSQRVTFRQSSFVVHESAELVVIAPDAKQPRIPWRSRDRVAAMALAAWEVGRHLGR
jgi:hypothetical protein